VQKSLNATGGVYPLLDRRGAGVIPSGVQVIVERTFETDRERVVDVFSEVLSHHVRDGDREECTVQTFGIGERIEYAHQVGGTGTRSAQDNAVFHGEVTDSDDGLRGEGRTVVKKGMRRAARAC
jgi:hypothetical protein